LEVSRLLLRVREGVGEQVMLALRRHIGGS
jgi:hypothetical protein